jgi:hypothetical protein
MRATAVSLLFFAALGCDEPKPSTKAAATQGKEKHATGPQEYVPPKPKPKDEPKTRDELFKEAWAGAKRFGEAADKEEPAITEKALRALTAAERPQIERFDMPNYDSKFGGAEVAGKLTSAGLGAWVARRSRERALAGPEFKHVMEVIWSEASGAQGLFSAMSFWWTIDADVRRDVVGSVAGTSFAAKRDPKVRDAILLLGGADWLAR